MANFRKALQEAVGIREAKEEDGLEEALASFVDDLDERNLVSLWNEYCLDGRMDDFIYLNDEDFFIENFNNPYDVVQRIHFGDYRYNDVYVIFDGYANLKSFIDPEVKVYKPELVEWLVDNLKVAEDYGFEYEEDEVDDEDEE